MVGGRGLQFVEVYFSLYIIWYYVLVGICRGSEYACSWDLVFEVMTLG